MEAPQPFEALSDSEEENQNTDDEFYRLLAKFHLSLNYDTGDCVKRVNQLLTCLDKDTSYFSLLQNLEGDNEVLDNVKLNSVMKEAEDYNGRNRKPKQSRRTRIIPAQVNQEKDNLRNRTGDLP